MIATDNSSEKEFDENQFEHNYCVGNKIIVMNTNPDQFGVGPGTIGTVTRTTAQFVLFETDEGIHTRRTTNNVQLVSNNA